MTELFSQAIDTDSVATLGTYLHFMQDSFSHAEFAGRDTWGQTTGGTRVDHTNHDPYRAMTMAHQTFDALKDFSKLRGCDCDGQPDWHVVQNFIDVGYRKGIRDFLWDFFGDVPDEHLRKKIHILGVPMRGPTPR